MFLTQALLDEVIKIAQKASDTILKFYHEGFDHSVKSDGSPLTQADIASHDIITHLLQKLTPDIPIISEENMSIQLSSEQKKQSFWLVDPLDGTKEFINRNGEFTVNIALIEQKKPVLGVIGSPAQKTIYAGILHQGAFKLDANQTKKSVSVQTYIEGDLYVVGSRSHNNEKAMKDYLANYPVTQYIPTGSSLKFCKIAEGSAHIYPRLGRTMEWDTAAGHAVLSAAGGHVETLDSAPLTYGKTGFENPHFIAKSQMMFN
ncbi:3'(2'),5'-bisphosphate nucleotidase [Legionella israelensis]|uniref:3'(2'),5'-bisphosphate nucleotidase CysQ n=1 Tax=Legionella israelensis TaxID=454 RepID=A0A0W0WNX0_9GAMM|nr:3'(2'),5'-bisphosphate nucleotidase CysQ [Legionella israelensis]KTD33992.1 inositol-1-monophosphatase [Legionella israelensis]QBR84523.1 3'(2'),5'-bisphosphate nucleotidase [Legionella israelensis]QBS10673.1 3'(2'),5'-bisphosphate nucleotidase [Legionella israelensis]SCX84041.1 3'(2'), 5'-bisphosphate nucleotidase [Legionella israelensis DSM 19235]STX57628.1 myo-inositol-1(or 4)-monophosphatase [Legionella israelensis]